mmetsp:Transcript_3313/g.14817  ORF Transcript_3313/g.14817 Transcript_3313/m.14817 type:complete len:211 (+) Transcript_3313:129-761(+)
MRTPTSQARPPCTSRRRSRPSPGARARACRGGTPRDPLCSAISSSTEDTARARATISTRTTSPRSREVSSSAPPRSSSGSGRRTLEGSAPWTRRSPNFSSPSKTSSTSSPASPTSNVSTPPTKPRTPTVTGPGASRTPGTGAGFSTASASTSRRRRDRSDPPWTPGRARRRTRRFYSERRGSRSKRRVTGRSGRRRNSPRRGRPVMTRLL